MKLIESLKKEAALILILVVLSLAAFIIYYPGATGPYMLDDFLTLKNNEFLKMESLDLQSLRSAAFSIPTGPLYRPVSMASFALNYYFADNMDGYPIKLINIVIHLMTGWGVFLLSLMLLRRQIKAEDPDYSYESKDNWSGITAVFIAAIWLLHPLHVSTVLYTVQRMTELSAMFSFYAAAAYVKGRNDLISGKKAGLLWVLGAVMIGGSLAGLSKENGFLLPFLLLAIEAAFFRFRFHSHIRRNAKYAVYGTVILPCMGILIYLTSMIIKMPQGAKYRDFTLIERLLTESRVIFYYIRLILLPDIKIMGLNYDYYTVSRGLLDPPLTLISMIGIVLLLAFTVYGVLKNRFPVLTFAILWFLAGHLLESTIVPLELVFEHRNYLPGFGILFAAGYYVSHAIFLSKRIPGGVRYAVMLLLLMLLAFPLYQRVGHWALPSKFFMNEIKNHPESARTIGGLAFQQAAIKQYSQAASSYKMAFNLAPYEAGYLIACLDTIIFKLNESPPPGMIDAIERTLRNYKISHFAAYSLFSIADSSLSLPEDDPQANRDLIERLILTAVSNPFPWPTNYNLGSVLFHLAEIRFRQNRIAEAAVVLEKVASLIPDKYDARLGLARIYLNSNEINKASEQIEWLDGQKLDDKQLIILTSLKKELRHRL